MKTIVILLLSWAQMTIGYFWGRSNANSSRRMQAAREIQHMQEYYKKKGPNALRKVTEQSLKADARIRKGEKPDNVVKDFPELMEAYDEFDKIK